MKLDWEKLLSTSRHDAKPKDPGGGRSFRSDFETDYDRAIYSSSFRRLGKKTQVHPMEKNAHVHNRLTHSLEVASVARSFGRRLWHMLEDRGELPNSINEYDIAFSLMAASLAHDIGNPPFGHAGEYAIREWLESHSNEFFPANFDDESLIADVSIFEGNAQGFRLASRKDLGELAYLQFTYCSLGAMVKYPWASTDPQARETGKYNFFSSEVEIAEAVFGEMGLLNNGQFARHPMSFLSEAADDICYRVIDIEDAVEINELPQSEAHAHYLCLLGESKSDYHESMRLPQLRAVVIGRLIEVFWEVFVTNFDQIMAGERIDDLKKGLSNQDSDCFDSVKDTNTTKIFTAERKVRVEIGAYQVMGRILKALGKATFALSKHQDLKAVPFIAQRCLSLAWSQEHLAQNAAQPFSWWIHQILDFISSMTDDRAIEVSNSINGFN
jgi:dGTPase